MNSYLAFAAWMSWTSPAPTVSRSVGSSVCGSVGIQAPVS